MTHEALKKLARLLPNTALRIIGDATEEVPIDEDGASPRPGVQDAGEWSSSSATSSRVPAPANERER